MFNFTKTFDTMKTTPNTTDSLVVLQAFDSSIKAEIAKSMLDSAGIFCVLHGEYMSTIYATGAFPTRLMVRPEDFEAAKQLLEGR